MCCIHWKRLLCLTLLGLTFGVSFRVYDSTENKLWSPTMEEVSNTHGLADGRALIPWSEWTAGAVRVRTEVFVRGLRRTIW